MQSYIFQKPNVAMLKQAMNTATPPTMNPSTSQQMMQQQDMHYDAQGLDSKGMKLKYWGDYCNF